MKKFILIIIVLVAATAVLTLSHCNGGSGPTVAVQGNVVGDASDPLIAESLGANAAAPAPATVPLSGPTAVVLVDETGQVAASQIVTAADGHF